MARLWDEAVAAEKKAADELAARARVSGWVAPARSRAARPRPAACHSPRAPRAPRASPNASPLPCRSMTSVKCDAPDEKKPRIYEHRLPRKIEQSEIEILRAKNAKLVAENAKLRCFVKELQDAANYAVHKVTAATSAMDAVVAKVGPSCQGGSESESEY